MTEAEKNEIVGLVMTQISSQAVDFDIATEQPQANDLLTAVRKTSSGEYMGVTLKWDDVARIATEVANRAAERAEQAETDANNILERVQSKGTEITNFVATSKTEIETQKNESVNAVKSVYQTDLNELKGDLTKHEENAGSFISSMNMFDYYSAENKIGYIEPKGGIDSKNTTYKTSHFIRVEPNTTYYVLGFYKNSTYGYNFAPFLCEYGDDKSTVVLWSTDVAEKITTQPTTKYIRFSYRATASYNRVGLSRVPFKNGITKPYNPLIIESKINSAANMIRFMSTDFTDMSISSTLNNPLVHSIRKNERIMFSGAITSFSGFEIGLKREANNSKTNRIVIDTINVTLYKYDGTIIGTYAHGLTIENDIQILCEVGFSYNLKLSLVSNGIASTTSELNNLRWERKYDCYLYAQSNDSVLKNCKLSWTCADLNKSVWMFGDSYFGYTDKWTYFLNKYGYINNVLMDSYGGKGSIDAITSLKTYLTIAKPKIVVWCMGMNDGGDTGDAPSTDWMNGVNELMNLSKIYDFNVVLSTIPTVPTINHEAKNAYVRANTEIYSYIDFAKGVGANSSGVWYGNMLSNDGVHPSNSGALALFMQAITDAPFLMIN